MQPTIIEKETLSDYHFIDHEVLNSADDVKIRKMNLNRALILGNAYRRKIKLIFETTDGIKQVETTIWAVTEQNVVLKGGKFIPINTIIKVKVY